MNSISRANLVVLTALLFCPMLTSAAPITAGDFTNPTVIDFDSIVGSQTLSPAHPNPFAAQGVTFTGFVTNAFGQGDFSGNELRSGFATGLPFVIRADFSVPVNRVGADLYSGAGAATNDTLEIRIFDTNGNLIESVFNDPAPSFTNPQFFGLESLNLNIARVEFATTGTLSTFPGLDNFRFEAAQSLAIPEMSTMALFGIFGTGLIICHWRNKRRGVLPLCDSAQ